MNRKFMNGVYSRACFSWGWSVDGSSLTMLMQSNQTFAQHRQGSPIIKNKTEIRHSKGAHHSPAYLRQGRPPTNKACSSVLLYLTRYQLLERIYELGGAWVYKHRPYYLCTLLLYCRQHLTPATAAAAAAEAAAVSNVWLRYSNKGADTVFPFHRANQKCWTNE